MRYEGIPQKRLDRFYLEHRFRNDAPFFIRLDGRNRVVGLYAAVSESTWEHLKLLFFPVLLYTVWEYIWLGHRWKGYVQVRAEGVLLGMLTITALFYTYTGICGGTGCGQISSPLCWVRLSLHITPGNTPGEDVAAACSAQLSCSHRRLLWRVQPVSACGGNFAIP
ncbi:MAG: DUF6512 family protein [Ruminococcus sp.]